MTTIDNRPVDAAEADTDDAGLRSTLAERLSQLREERERTQRETVPQSSGDDADRVTNVEGQLRVQMLDRRIAAVEAELAALAQPRHRAVDDRVCVGDVVVVDLGDGPERYLLGSVERASDELEVITPGSPLGQALLATTIGSTVRYPVVARRMMSVSLLGVA